MRVRAVDSCMGVIMLVFVNAITVVPLLLRVYAFAPVCKLF